LHFIPGSTLSATALVVDYGGSDLIDAGHRQSPDRRQSECWIEWLLVNRLKSPQSPLDFDMERRQVA
jgi:hypothetical protein